MSGSTAKNTLFLTNDKWLAFAHSLVDQVAHLPDLFLFLLTSSYLLGRLEIDQPIE